VLVLVGVHSTTAARWDQRMTDVARCDMTVRFLSPFETSPLKHTDRSSCKRSALIIRQFFVGEQPSISGDPLQHARTYGWKGPLT
jgi:hypothetical protein